MSGSVDQIDNDFSVAINNKKNINFIEDSIPAEPNIYIPVDWEDTDTWNDNFLWID